MMKALSEAKPKPEPKLQTPKPEPKSEKLRKDFD